MYEKLFGTTYDGKTVTGYDEVLRQRIKKNWDGVAKPLDSLGTFEEVLSKIGAIQGRLTPNLIRARLLVSCADNGIVEEGVSQCGQEVTAICAGNIANGRSSVAIMAKQAGVEVCCIDVGINTDKEIEGVQNKKVRQGTRNFRKEPALTSEEVVKAIQTGMDLVRTSKEEGVTILGIGEMGIGNTTTSSAVTAALLGLSAEVVTGRGAGLSDEALERKKAIIREALFHYGFQTELGEAQEMVAKVGVELGEKAFEGTGREEQALKALQSFGGLDLACMAGICIGGAHCHVPIVLDGFISLAAALVACRLLPITKEFLIASHSGKEPAMKLIEEELGLSPVLRANMALGEGTGAVLMLQLLKTVNAVYEDSISFETAGIDQYERF
jgi:nicotinate-nucleotide--dimethylbenzimidazole phosphoribosyltransferase